MSTNDRGKQPMNPDEFYFAEYPEPCDCHRDYMEFAEAYASYREQANAERIARLDEQNKHLHKVNFQQAMKINEVIGSRLAFARDLQTILGLDPMDDESPSILDTAKQIVERCRAAEFRCKELREALQAIADGGDCDCDHDTEDCCAETDYYCPSCIAGAALAKGQP